MKVCDKTCIFCFFPIINKYLCMAKRSLLSRCPSYTCNFISNGKAHISLLEHCASNGPDDGHVDRNR